MEMSPVNKTYKDLLREAKKIYEQAMLRMKEEASGKKETLSASEKKMADDLAMLVSREDVLKHIV